MSVLDEPNPVLKEQPSFAFSLLLQAMMNGIVLTLTVALIGLLVFSARYHWPLAKHNFALQSSALVCFLIIMITNIVYILTSARDRSRQWPFMFRYVELLIPPVSWTRAQHVGVYTLLGLLALLCHCTHIQFLTLLFPSSLERKLIIMLLSPLALASSGLIYLSLHPNPHIQDLGDAIRAICNSSLTLLYTAALVVWGLFINRSRAWRTEGSAAAFGALAVSFGIAGSILNYIEIKEDRLMWLQNGVWCILLWQSWLSFWWWVSAGMYAGEVADRDVRAARKRKSKLNHRARKRRQAAGTALPALALSATGNDTLPSRLVRRIGLRRATVAVPESASPSDPPELTRIDSSSSFARLTDSNETQTRRHSTIRPATEEGIEMQDLGTTDHQSESSSSNNTSWKNYLPWPRFVGRLIIRLQAAHNHATRSKALELPLTRDPQGPFPSVFNRSGRPISSISPPSDSPSNTGRAYEDLPADPSPSRRRGDRGAGMPADSWYWRGRVRKARLRAVDTF